MNSSISSSEAVAQHDGTLWRRFAVTLVTAAAIILALGLAGIYLIEPYDTGRSPFFSHAGVRALAPATGNASRGRDPAFRAVIAGNSRIQLISPERLKKATGLDFVQMSVPGSGPKEQLALIDWFLSHRREPVRALLVSIDETWCTSDPALTNERPFPFWLYTANPLEYARGLLRWEVLEEVPPRLAYLLGMNAERARRDGYWDYDSEYTQRGDKMAAAHRQELAAKPYANAQRYDRDPLAGMRHFPAADQIGIVAASLPEDAAFILVAPHCTKIGCRQRGQSRPSACRPARLRLRVRRKGAMPVQRWSIGGSTALRSGIPHGFSTRFTTGSPSHRRWRRILPKRFGGFADASPLGIRL